MDKDFCSDRFILGDANAICDICGFKYKLSHLKKQWDGAMACEKDFSLRNPQDFLRAKEEFNNLKDPRPEPEYVFFDD